MNPPKKNKDLATKSNQSETIFSTLKRKLFGGSDSQPSGGETNIKPPKEEKKQFSRETKSKVNSIFDKKTVSSEVVGGDFKTPKEALSGIYDLMVKIERQRQYDYDDRNDFERHRQNQYERRNKEIIRALTGRQVKLPQQKIIAKEKELSRFRLPTIPVIPIPRIPGTPGPVARPTPTPRPPVGGPPATPPVPPATPPVPPATTPVPAGRPTTPTTPVPAGRPTTPTTPTTPVPAGRPTTTPAGRPDTRAGRGTNRAETPTTPSVPAGRPTPSVPAGRPTPSVPAGRPDARAGRGTNRAETPTTPSVPAGRPSTPTTPSVPAGRPDARAGRGTNRAETPTTPSVPAGRPSTPTTPSVPAGRPDARAGRGTNRAETPTTPTTPSVPAGRPTPSVPAGRPDARAGRGTGRVETPTRPPTQTQRPATGVNLDTIIKFTARTGSRENFEKLDPSLKQAVIAAATDYHAKTGKQLILSSSFRTEEDQRRLWNEAVAHGKRGPKGEVLTPQGHVIAPPGGYSSHGYGLAIDIQNWRDPEAVAALNRAGLFAYIPNDPVHFQLARDVHNENRRRIEQDRMRGRGRRSDTPSTTTQVAPTPQPSATPVTPVVPPQIIPPVSSSSDIKTTAAFRFTIIKEQGLGSIEAALMPVTDEKDARKKGLPVGTPGVGAATLDTSGSTSYGVFGINNKRELKNGKPFGDSTLMSFLKKYGAKLGLPSYPGSQYEPDKVKQFNEAWWAVARSKPKELLQAQIDFFESSFENETKNRMRKEGFPSNVYNDPGVQIFMTDRAVQYGKNGAFHRAVIEIGRSSQTAEEFVARVTAYDSEDTKNKYFRSQTDAWWEKNERGLRNRIQSREREANKNRPLGSVSSMGTILYNASNENIQLVSSLGGRRYGSTQSQHSSVMNSNSFNQHNQLPEEIDDRPALIVKGQQAYELPRG